VNRQNAIDSIDSMFSRIDSLESGTGGSSSFLFIYLKNTLWQGGIRRFTTLQTPCPPELIANDAVIRADTWSRDITTAPACFNRSAIHAANNFACRNHVCTGTTATRPGPALSFPSRPVVAHFLTSRWPNATRTKWNSFMLCSGVKQAGSRGWTTGND